MQELGSPLIVLGEVTSTMDVARRLESLGAPEGIAVIAASQSHGRGRSDRTWQSPRGSGLYCSILLRPNIPADQFRPFSIAAGLAICDALDPTGSVGLRLKWPNDIIVHDKKLAGILITSSLTGPNVTSAVLGIGINLHPDPHRPPGATSLSEIAADTNFSARSVSQAVSRALTIRYSALLSEHPFSAAGSPPTPTRHSDEGGISSPQRVLPRDPAATLAPNQTRHSDEGRISSPQRVPPQDPALESATHPLASPLDGWQLRLAYLGEQVALEDCPLTHTGILAGIDPTGALILATPTGLQNITSGDLTRGPRPLDNKERMF